MIGVATLVSGFSNLTYGFGYCLWDLHRVINDDLVKLLYFLSQGQDKEVVQCFKIVPC